MTSLRRQRHLPPCGFVVSFAGNAQAQPSHFGKKVMSDDCRILQDQLSASLLAQVKPDHIALEQFVSGEPAHDKFRRGAVVLERFAYNKSRQCIHAASPELQHQHCTIVPDSNCPVLEQVPGSDAGTTCFTAFPESSRENMHTTNVHNTVSVLHGNKLP